MDRVGTVAYKLQLPSDCLIHPVIHVSQLKAATGYVPPVLHQLPTSMDDSQVPVQFLDHRTVRKGNSVLVKFLTQWSGVPV